MPQTDDKIIEIDGKKYYAYNFPRPSVTVDCVVFGIDAREQNNFKVLLIKRKNPPFEDCWALPGGFMNMDETIVNAALRELVEETRLSLSISNCAFVGVFDAPERDPRGRVISHAYSAWVNINSISPCAGDDAKEVGWFKVNELPDMAFDHWAIINMAVEKFVS